MGDVTNASDWRLRIGGKAKLPGQHPKMQRLVRAPKRCAPFAAALVVFVVLRVSATSASASNRLRRLVPRRLVNRAEPQRRRLLAGRSLEGCVVHSAVVLHPPSGTTYTERGPDPGRAVGREHLVHRPQPQAEHHPPDKFLRESRASLLRRAQPWGMAHSEPGVLPRPSSSNGTGAAGLSCPARTRRPPLITISTRSRVPRRRPAPLWASTRAPVVNKPSSSSGTGAPGPSSPAPTPAPTQITTIFKASRAPPRRRVPPSAGTAPQDWAPLRPSSSNGTGAPGPSFLARTRVAPWTTSFRASRAPRHRPAPQSAPPMAAKPSSSSGTGARGPSYPARTPGRSINSLASRARRLRPALPWVLLTSLRRPSRRR